jgi:transposase
LTAFSKAKVEVAVLLATRWIIAKLRKRQFFSLSELNAAIAVEVAALNARVTRHLGASRKALFEELERGALKQLPLEPYLYAEWKECRVGIDYHVEIEKHYYSAPYQLLRETVWARITARTVEVFHKIGRNTSALIEVILREKTHPEQGFRACVGILRLTKSHGDERLEAACERALEIGARSYTSVNSILKNNLDRRRPETATDGPAISHTNIRGPGYFH